jgi:hypothetical protein
LPRAGSNDTAEQAADAARRDKRLVDLVIFGNCQTRRCEFGMQAANAQSSQYLIIARISIQKSPSIRGQNTSL